MARVHDSLVGKTEQHLTDRPQERRQAAARQVRAANRPGKQRVTDEKRPPGVAVATDGEADAAWTVAWRVVDPRRIFAERPGALTVIELVDRRLRVDLEPERLSLLHDRLVQEVVVAVQHDRRAERFLRPADAGDVIEVGVRQQDVANREPVVSDRLEEQFDVVARVDDDAFPGVLAAQYEAVLLEGRDRP